MMGKIGVLALALCSLLFMNSSNAKDSEIGAIDLTGEVRARYESLDGQFRSNTSGGDQLLLFRSLLHGTYRAEAFTLGLELQDSRTYLGDRGTPLSNSFVNATDVLQAYVSLNTLPSLFGDTQGSELKLGRQTISIGSKRQIERVSFANVIKSYTGIYSRSQSTSNDELHAFYAVPVERLPSVRDDVEDNEIELDEEQWNRRMWGLHYRKSNLFGSNEGRTWGEVFAYGLDENDTSGGPTPNRHYVTAGFRLYRPHASETWDYDIEAAFRTGHRHRSSDPDDREDLDTKASMLLFKVGYTFAHPLNPNLAFQYYYASGDKNPEDDNFDQFERLFGGRRTDLNNTSIHGPLTPANLSAMGFRIELRPDSFWDARLHYSAAHLASETDSFVIGKFRDESGQSGSFLGHTIDTRVRIWSANKAWTLDVGMSLFFPGSFLSSVREAEERLSETTNYGYAQLIYKF